MEALHATYLEHLNNLKTAIQESELLARYLEEEGDEEYKNMVDTFEPHIHQLHESVTYHSPLQLLSLEKALLDDGFEGLYIPRLLGYSVLRGYVGADVKFSKPQNHFKDIILFSCNSPNFEQIQKRIGQAIQVGFALSSDVWIASLIDSVENKKIKSYLLGQKLYKFQDINQRRTGLFKYRKQFQSLRFMTASFPDQKHELVSEFEVLRHFLKLRYEGGFDNSSLLPSLKAFIGNTNFHSQREFVELLIRIGLYFELDAEGNKLYTATIDELRKNYPNFEETYLSLMEEHWNDVKVVKPENEKRLASLINRKIDDRLTKFYAVIDEIYGKGYVHDDVIEAVNKFYFQNEGRSVENANIRCTILSQINIFLSNVDVDSYTQYFELQRVFTQYVELFGNQQFNQDVKGLSLKYIKKLLKVYIDKRGKDYQDIKRFVKTTFLDLGFMSEKELVELFKTKRKPKETDKE